MSNRADAVVDNVSGPGLDGCSSLLRGGGVYVTSGAIAGPQVTLDKRTLYLRDLSLSDAPRGTGRCSRARGAHRA